MIPAYEFPLISALFFSLLVNIPQLYHTYTSKNADDLSAYTIVMRIVCQVSWIIYATMVKEYLIIAVTVQNIFTEAALLYLKKVKFAKKPQGPYEVDPRSNL